jgi:hypothetical protein
MPGWLVGLGATAVIYLWLTRNFNPASEEPAISESVENLRTFENVREDQDIKVSLAAQDLR